MITNKQQLNENTMFHNKHLFVQYDFSITKLSFSVVIFTQNFVGPSCSCEILALPVVIQYQEGLYTCNNSGS